MRILFVSPLPPPVHGHSLAGEMALRFLERENKVAVIDSAMDKTFSGNVIPPLYAPQRLWAIVTTLVRDFRKSWLFSYDVVYLSVGLTFRGFMRYAPYMVASLVKGEPYVIHTHGATFRDMYEGQNGFKRALLRFFCRRASRVIVLGDSLVSRFKGIVNEEKIRVCHNGVSSEFRLSAEETDLKIKQFNAVSGVKLLFLSNLMRAKGILELMEAFERLPEKYTLDLCGLVEPDRAVVQKIEQFLEMYPERVKYHGLVIGNSKMEVLKQAHLFVLPSKNEGQPISILEAYSAACAVVTDPKVGGIRDVFSGTRNGVAADHASAEAIASAIEECSRKYADFAIYNYTDSERYSAEAFGKRVQSILFELV